MTSVNSWHRIIVLRWRSVWLCMPVHVSGVLCIDTVLFRKVTRAGTAVGFSSILINIWQHARVSLCSKLFRIPCLMCILTCIGVEARGVYSVYRRATGGSHTAMWGIAGRVCRSAAGRAYKEPWGVSFRGGVQHMGRGHGITASIEHRRTLGPDRLHPRHV